MFWLILKVVVAVFVSHTIGMNWHGPMGFLDLWCSYVYPGVELKDIPDHGSKPIWVTSVAYLCGAFLINYLLQSVFAVQTVFEALQASVFLAGIVGFSQVPHYAFPNRPLGLYLLDRAYDTTIIVTMGLITYIL